MGGLGADASKCVLFCLAFDNCDSHGQVPRKARKTCEDPLPFLVLLLAQESCFASLLPGSRPPPGSPGLLKALGAGWLDGGNRFQLQRLELPDFSRGPWVQ